MDQHRPPKTSEYDADFYAWTQHQAKALRALQDGRHSLPHDLDIDHLAEEIEDLGKAELRSVTSLIRQILVHLIKAASDPKAGAFAHWRAEVTAFYVDLPDRYAPSMRQPIDMDVLWRSARKVAQAQLQAFGGSVAPRIPTDCPFSLDQLLAEDFSSMVRSIGSMRRRRRRNFQ
jgi:hypothetical protein